MKIINQMMQIQVLHTLLSSVFFLLLLTSSRLFFLISLVSIRVTSVAREVREKRVSRDEVGLYPVGASEMNQSDITGSASIAAAERGESKLLLLTSDWLRLLREFLEVMLHETIRNDDF